MQKKKPKEIETFILRNALDHLQIPIFVCPFPGCEFQENSSVNVVKQHYVLQHDSEDPKFSLNFSQSDQNRLLVMISECFPLWDRTELIALKNQAESVSIKDQTEFVPIKDQMESVRSMDQTESLPIMDQTESLPLMDQTESLPIRNQTESVPLMDQADFAPLKDKMKIHAIGSDFQLGIEDDQDFQMYQPGSSNG